jgi:hypothetical protein
MDHNWSADSHLKYVIAMCVSWLVVETWYLLAAFDSSYPHAAQPPSLQTICEPTAQQKITNPNVVQH